MINTEIQKTAWVEKDILPTLMSPAFNEDSVKQIYEKLKKKNERNDFEITPQNLARYITKTALRKTEPGLNYEKEIDDRKPADMLECRIGILQKHWTEASENENSLKRTAVSSN
jgi:hypothetical protein